VIVKHRGMARARVAVARKLATILRRTWVDNTEFRLGREQAADPIRALSASIFMQGTHNDGIEASANGD
jgi:hypothetical protein